MKTLQEKIAVMQAAADGKKLQFKGGMVTVWCDCLTPSWDWVRFDYRVKPAEPKKLFVVRTAKGEYYQSNSSRGYADSTASAICGTVEEYIQVLPKEG